MTIDPGKKGWLTNYLEYRKALFQSFFEQTDKDLHPEQSLYKLLQPNGLLYGHPILKKDIIEEDGSMSNLNKIKVLMAESLINGSLILRQHEINSEDDFSEVIMETVRYIGNFYQKVYPELSVSGRTLFGRKKSPLEIAEKILEKRIDIHEGNDNFWLNFFNNSLLFLDIYLFGQWLNVGDDKHTALLFKNEKDTLRLTVVKVLAAAAHANQNIEEEEQGLFDYFLQSSQLSATQKEQARNIFKEGVDIVNIDIPSHNSWLLKRYFLEMAILIVWADRKLEESEYAFLKRLNSRLGFHDEDLENSLLAVEGFVLENWEYLEDLRSGHEYKEVSQEYLQRVHKLAERNAARIASEVEAQSELQKLLSKARSGNLTDQEAALLKEDLINVLKRVPTFVIIGLPTAFLTLPMLLKILPEDILPKEE